MARKDFETLGRVWSHCQISRLKKVKLFQACIVSRLVYGLAVACLNAADRRRLDGFQAGCLRKILGIPASYISRVPNTSVPASAGQLCLSKQILKQQMIYVGKLARRSADDPVRSCILKPGSIDLRELPGRRRVGRPRNTWAAPVLQHSVTAAKST